MGLLQTTIDMQCCALRSQNTTRDPQWKVGGRCYLLARDRIALELRDFFLA
jgi:hypothetical protein